MDEYRYRFNGWFSPRQKRQLSTSETIAEAEDQLAGNNPIRPLDHVICKMDDGSDLTYRRYLELQVAALKEFPYDEIDAPPTPSPQAKREKGLSEKAAARYHELRRGRWRAKKKDLYDMVAAELGLTRATVSQAVLTHTYMERREIEERLQYVPKTHRTFSTEERFNAKKNASGLSTKTEHVLARYDELHAEGWSANRAIILTAKEFGMPSNLVRDGLQRRAARRRSISRKENHVTQP